MMRTLTIQIEGPDGRLVPVVTVSTNAEPGMKCRDICFAAVALAQVAHPGAVLCYGWDSGNDTAGDLPATAPS